MPRDPEERAEYERGEGLTKDEADYHADKAEALYAKYIYGGS